MTRIRYSVAIAAVVFTVVFAANALYAQSDVGSIVGFVKDPSGAVIPHAKVIVMNEATKEEHTVVTDSLGHYTVTNLLPGNYTVTAQASGFKMFQSTHNKLNANSTLSLDAQLAVGTATETVEVSASASSLQTESASVQSNVSAQQIEGEELNGRNPLYMAQLTPGVRSNSTLGDFNFTLTNGGLNVNGTRQQDTLITMDGAPATRTRGNGTSIGVPDVDATQEIQVLDTDYAAEYGGAAGGQIRIVTKSGGTDFHGSAFEYFRNSDLNANTWTRNLTPSTNFASPFRYNDFGFDFGGPVEIPGVFTKLRQKFFFYVAQEWNRYRFADTQTQAVPTDLMRQGNFSELLSANPWYKGVTPIYDPATCPVKGGPGCMPFPGNIIPKNRLSPNGIAIMNAYPAPTPGFLEGTQNWIAQANHPINQRKGTWNGDILPNEKNHIEFRRTDYSYFEYQPFDQGSGLTGKYFDRPNQTNALAWTTTISPTLINEVRATISIDDVYIPVNTALNGFNRSVFGIDYPYIFGNKDIAGKIPTVVVPAFYGLSGGPYPSHSSGVYYTLSDSVTKVAGNHTFKAGFYGERSGENDRDQINVATVPGGSSNQNGTFQFTDSRAGLGATSGVGLANLALGLADSYTEIGPRAYTIWRGDMFEWFAQDAWKATTKLTITYGIRDTITQPFHALWGNADYFDPSLYKPANAVQVNPTTGNVMVGSGNQYNGVVIPGLSGFPSYALGHGVLQAGTTTYNSLFDPNLPQGYLNTFDQFQPRLGLAYQLTNTTVLRAGAGRFLTRMNLLDNIFPGGNSPFQPFVTVTNVSVDNPGAALNSSVAAPITITTLNRSLKPPSVWSWNVTVQQQLPWKMVLSAAYVGNRGLDEWEVFDINQPTVGALLANPGVNINYLRPYKGFAAIQQEQSTATSRYNSLQLDLSRRFAGGLGFEFAYTLSKSMDNSSAYRDIVPDTYNTSNLWGPSEFDTRNVAILNLTYDLPFFKSEKGLTGRLLGGWQVNSIFQAQSGTPCSVVYNSDYAGVGEVGNMNCSGNGQYWVMNGTPSIIGGFAGSKGGGAKWFTTTNASGQALFTAPPAGTFNLQPGIRDSIYGPGLIDWNLGLFKSFRINERTGFEFRAEAYDVDNHPNLSGPNLNPTSSQFGEITSKTTLSRNLQLSLRYYF
jgi:hypothetical protein